MKDRNLCDNNILFIPITQEFSVNIVTERIKKFINDSVNSAESDTSKVKEDETKDEKYCIFFDLSCFVPVAQVNHLFFHLLVDGALVNEKEGTVVDLRHIKMYYVVEIPNPIQSFGSEHDQIKKKINLMPISLEYCYQHQQNYQPQYDLRHLFPLLQPPFAKEYLVNTNIEFECDTEIIKTVLPFLKVFFVKHPRDSKRRLIDIKAHENEVKGYGLLQQFEVEEEEKYYVEVNIGKLTVNDKE